MRTTTTKAELALKFGSRLALSIDQTLFPHSTTIITRVCIPCQPTSLTFSAESPDVHSGLGRYSNDWRTELLDTCLILVEVRSGTSLGPERNNLKYAFSGGRGGEEIKAWMDHVVQTMSHRQTLNKHVNQPRLVISFGQVGSLRCVFRQEKSCHCPVWCTMSVALNLTTTTSSCTSYYDILKTCILK